MRPIGASADAHVDRIGPFANAVELDARDPDAEVEQAQ
ncbi:MAG: hypothetical protein JWQ47_1416 [Glaciihabitans sp.]|jgi:hypothetical protein|nr:hypothetical protein [Glaciihabitans sp.]